MESFQKGHSGSLACCCSTQSRACRYSRQPFVRRQSVTGGRPGNVYPVPQSGPSRKREGHARTVRETNRRGTGKGTGKLAARLFWAMIRPMRRSMTSFFHFRFWRRIVAWALQYALRPAAEEGILKYSLIAPRRDSRPPLDCLLPGRGSDGTRGAHRTGDFRDGLPHDACAPTTRVLKDLLPRRMTRRQGRITTH